MNNTRPGRTTKERIDDNSNQPQDEKSARPLR